MERLALSGWFEIFKTGVWHGIEYGKDNLDEIVRNFDKGEPKVPLIIGHNDFWGGDEKPALGWVSALKRVGNKLMAKAEHVSAELVEAVNDRVYPMRSIELWGNYHGRGLALGAIAFLGGSNPEVGGMADFKFSKAPKEPGYLMESQDGERRCFVAPSQIQLVADNAGQVTQHNHHRGGDQMTKEEMDKAIAEGVAAGINQFKTGPEFTALQAENKRLAEELTAANHNAAAARVEADTKECLAFAKGLLDTKKITPAQHNAGLGAFLASLDNSEKLEFASGKSQTRREFAMGLLDSAAPKTDLFKSVDSAEARDTDDVPSAIEAFAKKHGLDPKIVAAQYRKQITKVDDDTEE